MLGDYVEAKKEFESIVLVQKHSVAAFKGIAECCINIGKKNASAQLLARARDNFQEAVENLTQAIIEKSDLSCSWKLLGDVCYNVSLLPEKYCFLDVNPGLIETDSKESKVKITLKEILSIAIR